MHFKAVRHDQARPNFQCILNSTAAASRGGDQNVRTCQEKVQEQVLIHALKAQPQFSNAVTIK